jgi:valyl-tRNA synthetase
VRAVEVRMATRRDAVAERARLDRQLADAREALRRSEELLAKPGFVDKAPAKVVEMERSRLTERRERVRLLEEETRRL